jgi:hypothetical protein
LNHFGKAVEFQEVFFGRGVFVGPQAALVIGAIQPRHPGGFPAAAACLVRLRS